MSRIRADRIVNRAATGAPSFPNGAVVTGVCTATSFSGNATGLAAGATGSDLTLSGNVSVGGTLTYQDVTNVDSVGLITARSGVDFNGHLRESVNIVASKLSAAPNINLDNGMVHYFTTTEDTTATPNIRSSSGINTDLAVGDTASVTIITTAAAAGYAARVNIDGLATGITTSWVGGSAPSAGGASGLDMYSYQIIKTADATFTVIGNLTNAA
tara:strand:- start:5858 stop:6499 length:642 start_codon:yes stop_codon:yes gene_type:complete